MSYQTLTIKHIRQETSDVKSFVLATTDGSIINYQPGQFLIVIFHTTYGEVRRSYSFSSHPKVNEPTITVKRIANGIASRWLFDEAKPGDILLSAGVSGRFTLDEDLAADVPVFLLAAGSGITPVMSLLYELLEVRQHRKVVFGYSTRSQKETIFFNELQALAQRFQHQFVLNIFHSDHKDLSRARLGRLALEALLTRYTTSPPKSLYFLCGPHIYMQNISITLLTEGVPEDNIRTEKFFNPLPPDIVRPPDTDPHMVEIFWNKKRYTIKVQYPQTILQAAKENNIALPFSCEAGRCGTCAATCTKGEVWMSRNEVLLDKEMANGRVLTCTGYPVGGDAELIA
jgi:ring-1,2-phenylacetyl-CoA epoxidase subunit PaaE